MDWISPDLSGVDLPGIPHNPSELWETASYSLGLEIYNEHGTTRWHDSSRGGSQILWVFHSHEMDYRDHIELRNAGCILSEGYVLITGDCLDRFTLDSWWNNSSGDFPRDFLRPGENYEIRVRFGYGYWTSSTEVWGTISSYGLGVETHWTPVNYVTMPMPEQPTPTPLPTIPPTYFPTPTSWTPDPDGFNPYDTNRNHVIEIWELVQVIEDYKAGRPWR